MKSLIKEIVSSKKVQDLGPHQVQQVLARRTENGKQHYLCKLVGQAPIHSIWLSQEQVLQKAGDQLKEFQHHGTVDLDRLFTPQRIIQLEEADFKACQAILKPTDPVSLKTLLDSKIALSNREKYQEVRSTMDFDLEKMQVIVQWNASELSLEQAVCVPSIFELLSQQQLARPQIELKPEQDQYSKIVTQLLTPHFNLNFKECQEPQLTPHVRSVLKQHSPGFWVDHSSLNCIQNEKKKKNILLNIVLNLLQQKKKVVLCTKNYQELIIDLEQKNVHTIELNAQQISHEMFKMQRYDVCLVGAQFIDKINGQNLDCLIFDSSSKLRAESCKTNANFKLLITKYDQIQQQIITDFIFNQEFSQQEQNQLIPYIELGYQNQILGNTFDIVTMTRIVTDTIVEQQQPIIKNDPNLRNKIEQFNLSEQQNALVLMLNQSFEDKVRQRMFIDSNPVLFKILNDDKKGVMSIQNIDKSSIGKQTYPTYISCVNYLTAKLLNRLWIYETENDETQVNEESSLQSGVKSQHLADTRQQLLSYYLKALVTNKINSCLIVVPMALVKIVTKFVSDTVENVQIIKELHETSSMAAGKLNVFIIDEQQVQAYYLLTNMKMKILDKKMLPEHIVFPFVSGHCSEIMIDQIYKQYDITPQLFIMCAIQTIEEHLLVYKQKFSHLMFQEFEEFDQIFRKQHEKLTQPLQIYEEAIKLIQEKGFNAQYDSSKLIDYHSFGSDLQVAEDQGFKVYSQRQVIRDTLCCYLHTDMLLQASFNDIFDISNNFNMHNICAELYGPQDPSVNIHHQSSVVYKYPGLQQVSVQNSDQTILENAMLHYYTPNQPEIYIRNGKPRLLEYFNPSPQNMFSININDWLNKVNMSFPNTATDQIKNFLKKANQVDPMKLIKPTTFQDTKKKKTKNYYTELPVVSVPVKKGRYQINGYCEYTKLPPKKPTICNQCFSKQQVYGAVCDLCEQKMAEQLDLSLVEQVDKLGYNHVVSLKKLLPDRENISKGLAEFAVNNQLNLISYPGGSRFDNLVVTPLDQIKDEEYEFLTQILTKPEYKSNRIKAVAAAFSLIDEISPLYSYTIKRKVPLNNKLKVNGQIWTQTYMNHLVKNERNFVGFARLIHVAVPYYHFQAFRAPDIYQDALLDTQINAQNIQQYCVKYLNNYITEKISQNNSDNTEFFAFNLQHQISNSVRRISNRFSPQGQADFFKQLIDQVLSSQYEFLPSSSIFNNKLVVNDSYIAWMLVTNIFSTLTNYQNVKVSIQNLRLTKQQSMNTFVIQKYYRYIVRNVSMHTPFYYLIPDQTSQQKFCDLFEQNQNKPQLIKDLMNMKWNPIQVLAGQFNDINFTTDKEIMPDPKHLEQIMLPEQEIQLSILQQKPTIQPYPYPQPAPPINQQQHRFVAPPAPVERQEQRSVTSQQTALSQNLTNQRMQSINQNMNQPVVVIPPIIQQSKPIEPVQHRIPTQKTYFIDYIMQIFNQDKTIKMNDIVNRIMQQYTPKNYLCKQNLLYLPDIQVAQGNHVVDVFPLQLGIKIDDKKREIIQRDTYCSFNEYVTQLCNTYAENEAARSNFNPYKFWVLTKETLAKVQDFTKSSKVDLKLFTQLNCIHEWVIKRSMLMDCDLINQKIIYFEQDPTTMLNLYEQSNYNDNHQKYSQMNDQNTIQLYQQAIQRLQKEIQELSQQQGLNVQKTVEEIATYGFGIGSSPIEVFSHYQKGYSQELFVIIGKIIQLFAACRMTKYPFPFQIKGYTDNNSINGTYFHMENIRLMYLKISQIDYFIWLTRIQKICKEKQDEESLKIAAQYHKNYPFQLMYKQKPSQEKMNQFEQMQKRCEEIDIENQQIMQIDQIFCQFIPQNSVHYDKQKQYPLPVFGINDCNNSTFRQAWLVSTAYKVLFLTIFGQRYDLVDEACKQKGFPTSLMTDIKKLYFDILNLWSRFHDYLLIFLQIELGRQQQVIQALDSPNAHALDKVQKKLAIIKPARLIDNFESVKSNPLVMLLNMRQPNLSQQPVANFPPKSFQKNNQFIYEKLGIMELTDCQNPLVLQQNLTQFKTFRIDSIISDMPSQLTTQQLDQRLRLTIKALRIERQLIIDPLEQQYLDEFINNPPEMLEMPNNNIRNQPQQQQQLQINAPPFVPKIQPPNIPIQGLPPPQFNPQQFSIPPIQIPQQPPFQMPMVKQEPTVNRIETPPQMTLQPQQVINAQRIQNEISNTQVNQPQRQTRRNQRTEVETQPRDNEVQLTDEQVELIRKKQLSFYKEDQETVMSFITELFKRNSIYSVFQNRKQPMDQFLFVQSSCQRQHSDEWGRLYSFLINMKPEAIVQSQQEAKEKMDQILKIALQLGIRSEMRTGLDQEVIQKLQVHLESPQGKQLRLFEVTQEYVQKNLEMAYHYAFQMREDVIKQPDANVNQYKANIHASLKQMQIMNQIPLNCLIQEKETTNKKKMALATYFFLAQSAK
ncbi:Conserved_hypothetical protein [Hexamita inflata]|uniref:Uncharacterized protein n=1 Tax=Hexamita inflata TaxID=28002 RepID=A0AA86P7N9_9EUKA|nr:Conserved hypothetical protein [Hexamita inflata]